MDRITQFSQVLYPVFVSRDRLIKTAEVAGGTEEKVQMCCYGASRWAEAY